METVPNNNEEKWIVGNTPVRQDKVEDTANDIYEQSNTPHHVQNFLLNVQITSKELYKMLRKD